MRKIRQSIEKENISSNIEKGECTVLLEYPPRRNALDTTLSAACKRIEKYIDADVLVMEDERILQITDWRKKSSVPQQFTLSQFMFFNGHVEKGKIGLKVMASRHNSQDVTILISSPNVELVKEINQGILNSQKGVVARSRIRGTPIASPNKWSPDNKKVRQPVFATPNGSRGSSVERTGLGGVPIARFAFGSANKSQGPTQQRQTKLRKSPQLDLDALNGSFAESVSSVGSQSSKPVVDTRELSVQQRDVLEAVLRGDSLFFTGGGGTGKSFLLKKLIKLLPAATTSITASTGIAACHINGTTLHHFLGMGRVDPGAPAIAQQILGRLRRNPERLDILKKTKTLIIDEISLIDAPMFELASEILSSIRPADGSSSKYFGGLQLVLSGDFLQLPPVVVKGTQPRFCFQSKLWKRAIKRSFQLTQIYRQAETSFAEMLSEIRFGQCSDQTARTLLSRVKHANRSQNSGSLKLLPLNMEVSELNEREISRIPRGVERLNFSAIDTVYDPQFSLDAVCVAKASLTLPVGARVILLATISMSDKLVNGATGTVVRFSKSPAVPYVQFDSMTEPVQVSMHEWIFNQNGKEIARRHQIPLALAWGVSIHKSQGMTLDSCEVSLDHIFEAGQAYVALSRCRSLEGLSIISNHPQGLSVREIQKAIRANQVCIDFYNSM